MIYKFKNIILPFKMAIKIAVSIAWTRVNLLDIHNTLYDVNNA